MAWFSSASVMAFTSFPRFAAGTRCGREAVHTVNPTRVILGVLSGIGFLGMSVIFRHGFNLRGLSAAPANWAVGGILVGRVFIVAGKRATARTVTVLALADSTESVAEKPRFTRTSITTGRERLSPAEPVAV